MSKFIANVKDLCNLVFVTILDGMWRTIVRFAFFIGEEEQVVEQLYDPFFDELVNKRINEPPCTWIDELWQANIDTMYYFIKDMREKYEA